MKLENAYKIKLLKILEILRQDSDEDHYIETGELLGKLSAMGIVCDRRTLAADIETLNNYGYEVLCEKSPGMPNRYCVADRSFSVSELRILMDAVQASCFVTPKKTDELVDKIAMGGRGTFAAGKNVGYTYKTVDKIEGVKVLQPVDSKRSFSMPPEAHSSTSYIVLDKSGIFHQYTEYNENHLPIFEIGYHFEKGMSKQGKHVFHIHEYSIPGIENRQPARNINPQEYEKYKKFFKGVK